MPAYTGVLIAAANTATDVLVNNSAVNPAGGDIIVNVNFANQNNAVAKVKLHLLTMATGDTVAQASNNIEPGRQIDANGVFERWAITLGPAQKLVALSDTTNVSVVPWGSN